MAHGAAARRYAKALFSIAQDEGRVPAIRAELAAFGDLLDQSSELREVLLTPLHPGAQRRAVLDAVADKVGAGTTLKHFYAFLIDQRRLVGLDAIRAEYERLADSEAGMTRATVRAASPLDFDQCERIRIALAQRTGVAVEFDVEVDPTLLGGVIAQVGDLVFDGSLRTQLAQLRTSLTGE